MSVDHSGHKAKVIRVNVAICFNERSNLAFFSCRIQINIIIIIVAYYRNCDEVIGCFIRPVTVEDKLTEQAPRSDELVDWPNQLGRITATGLRDLYNKA